MEKLQEILKSNNPKELLALFQFDCKIENERILVKFNLWARYFFPQYFESEDATFHDQKINLNNLKVYKGLIDTFVDVAFKGAGKDVKTKLFIAYAILNDTGHFRRYYKVLAEDGSNSTQTVTDIYNMLVNPKIGALYPNTFEKSVFKREETMSRFTTSTGIKVIADTIYTSQRGEVQEEARPDFIWFNDFETRKTLRSAIIMKSIWDNMEEARTGLQKGGSCVYTCNYISEMGNVHKLVTEKLGSHKVVEKIPIWDKDEVPTWKRYTVEDIKRFKDTDDDFEGERLCKPNASKDIYFDRDKLEVMPVRQPIENIAGFKIFRKYNSAHRYASGHDVAGGVGLDSSTSAFIDFSYVPAQVVATYASNTIMPEAFGDEIYHQANKFGGCLVAPENNKFDQTILKAKLLGAKIYTGIGNILKVHVMKPTTYGWNTNSLTKSNMMSALREAIESGLLELNDKDIIDEAKNYSRNDLMDAPPDPRLVSNPTRHFDLLTAVAIAWQMKDHARVTKTLISVDDFADKPEVNPAI